MSDKPTVRSPCIHYCVVKNDVCGGCGRTIDEITDWLTLNDDERKEVIRKSKERLVIKNLGNSLSVTKNPEP